MADGAIETLLMAMDIDLSPAQKAGEGLKQIFAEINKLLDPAFEAAKKAGEQQKSVMGDAKVAAQQATEAAVKAFQEQVKATAEQDKHNRLLKDQIEAQATSTAELKANLAALEAINVASQKETAELRKQLDLIKEKLAEHKKASESGGGFLGEAAGALFGGTVGKIASGVAIGEIAKDSIIHFIEKLKEASVEAGKLSLAMDLFNKSAKGVGVDGTKFISQLQEASEGLVGKLQLATFGARALQSSMKLSPEKIVELTQATIKLAEANGHTAVEAINALTMSMSRGGERAAFMLSRLTGIAPEALRIANMAPGMNRTQRSIESMNHAMAVIISQAAKLGEVPQTLEQAFTRITVVVKDLFESFGKGFNESVGGQVFVRMLTSWAKNLTEFENKVEAIGSTFGAVLAAIIPAAEIVKTIFVGIYDIITDVGKAFSGLLSGKDAGKESGLLDAIQAVGDLLLFVNGVIREHILAVRTLIQLVAPLLEYLHPEAKQQGTRISGGATILGETVGGVTRRVPASNMQILGGTNKPEASHGLQILGGVENGEEYREGGTGSGGVLQRITAMWAKDAEEQAKSQKAFDDAIAEARKGKKPGEQGEGYTRPPSDESNSRLQAQRVAAAMALDEEREKLKEQLAKAAMQKTLDDIKEEQRAEEKRYREGKVTIEQYTKDKLDLEAKAHKAHMSQLDVEAKAELKKNEEETIKANAQVQDPVVKQSNIAKLAVKQQEVLTSTAQKGEQERARNQATNDKIIEDRDKDSLAAAQANINAKLAMQEAYIKQMQELNKHEFDVGNVTPEEYFKTQQALTEQSAAAQIEAATNSFNAIKEKNNKDVEEFQAKVNTAVATANSKLQQLQDSYDSTVQRYIQKRYQPQQGALTTQLGFQQQNPNTPTADIVATMEKLEQLAIDERKAWEVAQQGVQKGSELWYTYQQHIDQAYQLQLKYNLELAKMLNMMTPIAQGMETIGKSIQENFRSKFAQNLAQIIQSSAKTLPESKDLADQIMGRQGIKKDPVSQVADQFKGVADSIKSPFQKAADQALSLADALAKAAAQVRESSGQPSPGSLLPGMVGVTAGGEVNAGTGPQGNVDTNGLPISPVQQPISSVPNYKSPTDVLSDWTKKLGAAAEAIDGFTQSILNAKSPLAGLAGGAMGGLSAGNTLDQMFKSLGPWGAVAGAIGGGIMGMITGGKQQQVTNQINQFTTDYKNIMADFATNTKNLQDTIDQITQLMAQVEQMQASSKKGGSQYQQLINQYAQQIIQLKTQQFQVITQMNEQVAILTQPTGMQDYITSLQSIIEQYQQFEGAAQNATDLANATTFLTESMIKYEQNMSGQLLQDNTQAITDALQLNDLLFQRQQFINNLNTQIAGVMQQGVLTRQLTFAQSKAQQVYQIQYNAQNQLSQMNEEIALQQYKVQSEGQIFQIATTRIGLETQLLALQKDQTDRSMLQIQGLQDLINQLSGTGGGAALTALVNAMPPVTNSSVDLSGLMDALVAAIYSNRGALGYQAYQGQNLG